MATSISDGSAEPQAHYALIDRLAAWCLSPTNREWVSEAAEAFFVGTDGYREEELEWLSLLFAVWLVHDYLGPGGETAAGRFLGREGHSLDAADRGRLAALHEHIQRGTDPGRFHLVEVTRVEPGRGLALRDLATGELLEVRERDGSRHLRPQEVLLVRTRPFPGATLLDHVVRLPRDRQAELLERLGALLEEVRQEAPDAGPVDVFRRFAPAVFHLCVVAQRPRAPDSAPRRPAEPLLLCRAHFRVAAPEALLLALGAHRSFEPRGEASWIWLSGVKRKGPLVGQRVVLGRLLVEERRLVLEAHSRRRLARGRALLEKVAGEAVSHLLDELSDPASHAPGSSDRPVPGGAAAEAERRWGGEMPGPARRRIEARHVRDHFQRWLDVALPMLDGRTPRQAARDPGLRARLAHLVRALEERLSEDPLLPVDLRHLRHELGLRPDE